MYASRSAHADWLLRTARFLTRGFMALFALGFLVSLAGLANGLGGYFGAYGPLPESAWALRSEVFPWVVAGLVAAAALFAAAFRFAQLLGNIVGSVSAGDPFTLANAGRLRHMGWLALVFQVLSLIIAWPSKWTELLTLRALVSGENLSLNGLMIAIVMFILARVFREGAEMRADLDGTV